MKNFHFVENALKTDTTNILIVGGECSGKSTALKEVAENLFASKIPMFAMTNDEAIISCVNKDPESEFVYKSTGAKIPAQIIEDIQQAVVLIDEYLDICQLLENIQGDKRMIMTCHANKIEQIPEILLKYFHTIVFCGMINDETKEKGITNVIYR